MSTIRELITSSLRLLGTVQAGQAPAPDDMDIGVQSLNTLVDSWASDRLAIYTIGPHYFPTVAGKRDYTLGPDADWNIQRPMRLEKVTVSPGQVLAAVPPSPSLYWLLPGHPTSTIIVNNDFPLNDTLTLTVELGGAPYAEDEVEFDFTWSQVTEGDQPTWDDNHDGTMWVRFTSPIVDGVDGAIGTATVTATLNELPVNGITATVTGPQTQPCVPVTMFWDSFTDPDTNTLALHVPDVAPVGFAWVPSGNSPQLAIKTNRATVISASGPNNSAYFNVEIDPPVVVTFPYTIILEAYIGDLNQNAALELNFYSDVPDSWSSEVAFAYTTDPYGFVFRSGENYNSITGGYHSFEIFVDETEQFLSIDGNPWMSNRVGPNPSPIGRVIMSVSNWDNSAATDQLPYIDSISITQGCPGDVPPDRGV